MKSVTQNIHENFKSLLIFWNGKKGEPSIRDEPVKPYKKVSAHKQNHFWEVEAFFSTKKMLKTQINGCLSDRETEAAFWSGIQSIHAINWVYDYLFSKDFPMNTLV